MEFNKDLTCDNEECLNNHGLECKLGSVSLNVNGTCKRAKYREDDHEG